MDRQHCPACGHEWNPDELTGTITDDSPEGLAQLWCFHLTRRKFGAARDLPADMAPEMANMIQLGIHPARIRTEILRKGRDRGEFMWQFKQRFGLGLPIKKISDVRQEKYEDRNGRGGPPTKEQQAELEKAREVWRLARGIGDMPES